ncbi:uncharacterized protein I206_101426 [Kwoniella pini CBS 10737]|uniref:Uncharacterized protein n=1 Tax=Kwoniella pini CBS 10737 TaxID=1296096 RepID=A0A1B9HWP3_9TREE|nr:uncharacterized protein I206_06603 [Kwoniella pini CBS 10737]OCF47697.1 hypothetical protein I206_06603 [Kwoniella pini CBS 10737]
MPSGSTEQSRPIWHENTDLRRDLRPHNPYRYDGTNWDSKDSQKHLNFNHNACLLSYMVKWRCSPYIHAHGWKPDSQRPTVLEFLTEVGFTNVLDKPTGWAGPWPPGPTRINDYNKSVTATLANCSSTTIGSTPYDPLLAQSVASQAPLWLVTPSAPSQQPQENYNSPPNPSINQSMPPLNQAGSYGQDSYMPHQYQYSQQADYPPSGQYPHYPHYPQYSQYSQYHDPSGYSQNPSMGVPSTFSANTHDPNQGMAGLPAAPDPATSSGHWGGDYSAQTDTGYGTDFGK